MKTLSRKSIFLILGIILVAIIVINSLSQPGTEQLNTKFKEISFTRNEQNAGPVMRSYIVTVDRLDLKEMEVYGNFMPHTKYGRTMIYFFDANKPFPLSVSLTEPFFPKQFENNYLAVYEKNGMGEVRMKENNNLN